MRAKWFIGVVAAIAITAGGSYKFGKAKALEIAGGHIQSRSKAIVSNAAQRPWKVVVLGDSIVELADVTDLCGRATLNAGLAGARAEDVNQLAAKLLPNTKPELIVIGVGTNDSWAGNATSDEDFAASYRSLILKAKATGAKVVLLTPPPLGSADLPLSSTFDSAILDRRIAQVKGFGVPVLDEYGPLADESTKRMRIGLSDDGAHPSAQGYVVWRQRLQDSCATLGGSS